MNTKGMGIALVSAVALLGAISTSAAAGELYLGAGVGSVTYESSKFVDCFGECQTFNDSDTAWTIFAGYELSEAVAVELGYSDYGTLKDSDALFAGNVKLEPDAITVAAVGSVPVFDKLSVFGKAGVAFLNVDARCNSCEVDSPSTSSSSQDLMLGGGLDYRIGQFRIRLEGQWIDAEDADKANYIGIAGIYGFNL